MTILQKPASGKIPIFQVGQSGPAKFIKGTRGKGGEAVEKWGKWDWENGAFVPYCPLSHFFSYFVPISHSLYTFPTISHNYPFFRTPPPLPLPFPSHLPTIFRFPPFSFTSAASWLIRLQLTPMPDVEGRF